MQISISKAKGRLADLVRRVEAGEEIVITRHGIAVVRFVGVSVTASTNERRTVMNDVL